MSTLLALTPLETAALAYAHARYRDFRMPPPAKIGVESRRNTGAGRLTRLVTQSRLTCADGIIDLVQFDMVGLPVGGMVRLEVELGAPTLLEIIVNGVTYWDGTEAGEFKIIEF